MRFLFVVKSKAIETLGPMYLSAIAKTFGHEAKIVSMGEAEVAVKWWPPDVIGYSVLTGNQLSFIRLNERLKKIAPDATTVVGGPHATFFPQDFVDGPCPSMDFIVKGEAENWMLNFLGQKGFFGGLDDIPFPDRSSFPDMKIRDFISTRGCPWSCAYCFNAKWHELYPDLPKVRYRSVENVISEIISVNPEFAYFQDSTFGVSMDWLRDFSNEYQKISKTPFHCHLRPSQVTPERISLLKAAGCMSTRIALETASDRLRNLIGRANTSNEETIRSATLLRKAGIGLMIQNMLGLPTSTIDDDLYTLEVNVRCKPDYAWSSIFSPFPGTALGDECKEKGWYTGNYSDITDCFFDMSVLNFPEEYKIQTYLLQKVFALAVETQCMPTVSELNYSDIYKFIHRAMRKLGDSRMYGGII